MADELTTCAECGTHVDPGTGFYVSLGTREYDELEVTFCTQEHASQWLAKPLPEPGPNEQISFLDHLIPVGCVVVLLAILALSVVGVIDLFSGVDVNPF